MTSKRCLITGAGGFIGSWLAEHYLDKGFSVWGTVHLKTDLLNHLEEKIQILRGDICDNNWVQRMIEESQPEVIFHLAAQSYIGPSWQDPETTFETNLKGTLNLLNSSRTCRIQPKIVILGSSAEYGTPVKQGDALSEDTSFRPSTPYAVSKVAEDMLGFMYWRAFQMPVVCVRPFALIGPRKSKDAISDFARAITAFENREANCISVGDLDVVRDFLDVRDGVRALEIVAEKGKPGEAYNLATGQGRVLKDLLNEMIQLSGHSIPVKLDSSRKRQADEKNLVGDAAKIKQLGWGPQIAIQKTLLDTLNYWREAFVPAVRTS